MTFPKEDLNSKDLSTYESLKAVAKEQEQSEGVECGYCDNPYCLIQNCEGNH